MREYAVILHVYEIGGGAYHAAVEVHGHEWQYGAGAGICSIEPGSAVGYKKHLDPISMGHTTMTKPEVRIAIEDMQLTWRADNYNLIHKNCCMFARRFLQELRAQPMPAWVDGWTDKVTPTVEAGVTALASRGAVLGAELFASRAATAGAGPAAWASAAGDLVGTSVGSCVGGKLGGAKGADMGSEVGGFSGSVAMGAGVGAMSAGPLGAGIGAGVGIIGWGVGKLVRSTIGDPFSSSSKFHAASCSLSDNFSSSAASVASRLSSSKICTASCAPSNPVSTETPSVIKKRAEKDENKEEDNSPSSRICTAWSTLSDSISTSTASVNQKATGGHKKEEVIESEEEEETHDATLPSISLNTFMTSKKEDPFFMYPAGQNTPAHVVAHTICVQHPSKPVRVQHYRPRLQQRQYYPRRH